MALLHHADFPHVGTLILGAEGKHPGVLTPGNIQTQSHTIGLFSFECSPTFDV